MLAGEKQRRQQVPPVVSECCCATSGGSEKPPCQGGGSSGSAHYAMASNQWQGWWQVGLSQLWQPGGPAMPLRQDKVASSGTLKRRRRVTAASSQHELMG